MRQGKLIVRQRVLALTLLAALLAACSSPQAPVIEAGERLVITPPEIVSSSQGDASRRSSTPGVTTTSSTQTVRPRSGASASASVHRVRPGETLFSIAFEHDLDFRSLAIANNLRPPYTIFVDQELQLDVSALQAGGNGSANAGNPVTDTGVVTTRAGGGNTGVFRQPIGSQSAPRWQWPYRGAIVRAFGEEGNEGLDIGGRTGDAVLAAGAGDVVYSGRGVQGVGNLIIIRHNDRYLSAYGHNSEMLVSEGDHVDAGEQIAAVGQNAAGVPMLHFEIREEGKSVDPSSLLP